MKKYNTKGFTLIEVLLVIAILAILAAVVIIAINPAKQLGEARDAQRRNDVRAIVDALQQYSIDNRGEYPDTIPWGGDDCLLDGMDICINGIACDGSNLDVLAEEQKYLADIPVDPSIEPEEVTGYWVLGTNSGRVSVCAPSVYGDDPIVIVQ